MARVHPAVAPVPGRAGEERRTAVIDLGSNSFRLVVFTAVPGSWWKRSDEIHEGVRIGAGLDAAGALGEEPMRRALRVVELYAHFCRASRLGRHDVQAVATSAIRDAANRDDFLARAREASGLDIRVLGADEEAWYGYLAAVNSTTLSDGIVLDVGGGSIQLVEVAGRRAQRMGSWPLGAVRMTEHFLADGMASKKQRRAVREHVLETLGEAGWVAGAGGRLVGLGGTVRNLAAAVQRRSGLPGFGVQGQTLWADALDELIADMAELAPTERGRIPGIKPQRGDVILAGALVVRAVMDAGGYDALETTEAGLREGVFLASHLAPADPPLFEDVREASVENLAAQYNEDMAHPRHVKHLALALFDDLAQAGVHEGGATERELLGAAAMLHDVGVAIDYDDHHKHSRYVILSNGLPGFSPREVAIIAQVVRYHRKGEPAFDDLEPLAVKGDRKRLERGAALLRIAEALERSRDQIVRRAMVRVGDDGVVRLHPLAREDTAMVRWVARRHAGQFERAFGRPLEII